jgi:serine/threonine protein kinase
VNLETKARTQAYLYAQVQSSALDLHIPKVYEVFSHGGSWYLVMEHIAAPSFHAWISEPNLSADEQTLRADVAVNEIANTDPRRPLL